MLSPWTSVGFKHLKQNRDHFQGYLLSPDRLFFQDNPQGFAGIIAWEGNSVCALQQDESEGLTTNYRELLAKELMIIPSAQKCFAAECLGCCGHSSQMPARETFLALPMVGLGSKELHLSRAAGSCACITAAFPLPSGCTGGTASSPWGTGPDWAASSCAHTAAGGWGEGQKRPQCRHSFQLPSAAPH